MRKVKNKISETDVLLNFLEDCKKSFRLNKKIAFEFPAGSWQGAKKRSIADIHGASIAGIEAKPDFNSAKKDFQNNKKNLGIEHYIYSSPTLCEEQAAFWIMNSVSACVYLTTKNKWVIINDKQGQFDKMLQKNKVIH